MNLRSYLRLLRPWRTLFVGLFYTFIGGLWARTFFHVPVNEQWFVAVALIGPIWWGTILVGPLHELMHQRFSMTLPRLCPALRQWHAAGTLVVAAAAVTVLHFSVGNLPTAGAVGFALGGLAIPMFNRRKTHWRGLRLWPLITILVVAIAIALFTVPLHRFGIAAPWLVAVAGAALYAGGLAFGFRQADLRARANQPVFCIQSTVLDRRMMAEANRAFVAKRGIKTAKPVRLPRGRFDGSVLSGVRFMNFLRLRGSLAYRLLWLMLIVPLTMLGGTHLMNKAVAPEITFKESVAQIAAMGGTGSISHGRAPVEIIFLALPVVSFALAIFLSQAQAWQFLPISRARLAQCHFAYTAMATTTIIVGLAVGMAAVLFVAQLATGTPPRMDVFVRVFALYAIAFPILPLAYCIASMPSAWLRIGFGVIAGLGAIVLGVVVMRNAHPWVLSPAGLAVCLGATVATNWVYWQYLRWIYTHRDLMYSADDGLYFGAALITTRQA